MSIELLIICEWVGVCKNDVEIPHPAWEQVESAVRALNNRNINDVYLQPHASSDEVWMVIGGGAGRYLVTGATSHERFPTLVNPKRAPGGYERLVVGGQEGEYPVEWIVDLEAALVAAHAFYLTGAFGGPGLWHLA